MEVLSFDDYFYSVWEIVPHEIVNGYMYSRNKELIKELSYGLWEIYKNTFKVDEYGFVTSEMSVQRASKILTKVFETIKNIGLRI